MIIALELCLALLSITQAAIIKSGIGMNSQKGSPSTTSCFDTTLEIKGCGVEVSNIETETAFDEDQFESKLHSNKTLNFKFTDMVKFNYQNDIIKESKTIWNEISFNYVHKLYKNEELGLNGFMEEAILEKARAFYQKSPANFIKTCGDGIITGAKTHAMLLASIKIRLDSSQDVDGIKKGLGIEITGSKGMVGFSSSLERTISKYHAKGSIKVSATQVGGTNPVELAKIFAGMSSGLECRLDNIAACKQIINNFIAYASNDFTKQLNCNSESSGYILLEPKYLDITPIEDIVVDIDMNVVNKHRNKK